MHLRTQQAPPLGALTCRVAISLMPSLPLERMPKSPDSPQFILAGEFRLLRSPLLGMLSTIISIPLALRTTLRNIMLVVLGIAILI